MSVIDAPPTTPPTAPVIGDFVKVTNNSPVPLTIRWDSKPYVLPPGKPTILPFEASNCWFGDPRSNEAVQSVKSEIGLVSWIPDRPTEVRRLLTLHGGQVGLINDRFDPDQTPNVTITDLSDNPIVTVLEDPNGTNVTQHIVTVSENDHLVSMLQSQQSLIDRMQARLDQLDPSNAQAPGEPAIGTYIDADSGQSFISTTLATPDPFASIVTAPDLTESTESPATESTETDTTPAPLPEDTI